MTRVQVTLSRPQAAHLTRRAAAKGISVRDAIVEAVEEQLVADERQRRIEVALVALTKPAFRPLITDPSETKEESIVRAIEERIGRP
jgi:hypothetical protein